MSSLFPYPPCESGKCDKMTWPNTVGMDGNQAKNIIEKDNQNVTGVIVPKRNKVIQDYCCNRVWIFVDDHGKVALIPRIG
ncbi:proteinase inhibitor-like [Olea europaea var. sylvestris]|uniref:proteinase inhibitor-like n=1 Tax=Olea europaea var. sylvestris TaxID=158386 RepID=UPI000C1D768C|nr:proteinase inhibitor-like [Olea europaea var. sylvestris]